MLCMCGCGIEVNPGRKYRKGHGRKGRKNSPEHTAKIVAANSGKKRGPSWSKGLRGDPRCAVKAHVKEKISIAMRTKIAAGWRPNITGLRPSKTGKRRPLTAETKAKIAAANSGTGNGMYGKTHDARTRDLIRAASLRNWSDQKFRAERLAERDVEALRRGAIAAACAKSATKPELRVALALDEAGIVYRSQVPMQGTWGFFPADFVIGSVVLEVDGIYWHSYPWGRPVDRTRTLRLRQSGWTVLRLWEHEALAVDAASIRAFIYDGVRPAHLPWTKQCARAVDHAQRLGHATDVTLSELCGAPTPRTELRALESTLHLT